MTEPRPTSSNPPTATVITQITATTHFPIKLTASNFSVWRKQIQATLIGLDLDSFINGSIDPPSQFLDTGKTKPNPAYLPWYRQDQTILSALLGSCSDLIQPLVSSSETSREAWTRLTSSYASASRSRVISLKAKLAKNPRGNRSIAEFLQDMKSIVDNLALAQSPVDDEDLLVHILTQLGDEYNPIVAALKVHDSSLSYADLYDKLLDFERVLKDSAASHTPLLATANNTHRQSTRSYPKQGTESPPTTRSSRPL